MERANDVAGLVLDTWLILDMIMRLTRVAQRCAAAPSLVAKLVPELRAALALRSALEWEEMFGGSLPCAAAARRIEKMFDHPQVLAEDLVTTLSHPVVGH